MTEHTPTDEQMQADWHAYITTPDEENYYYEALSGEEADARWSRWLAAHDARVRRDAAAGAWTDCVSEASALGWLHPSAARDMRDRNPHEETPVTEQQIDPDRLRRGAESALACGTFDAEVVGAVPQILDHLGQAEADRDRLLRSSRLAKEGRIKANARADQAEAQTAEEKRLRMEATAAATRAEARIKAVRDVLNTVEDGHSADPVIRGLFPRMVGTALIRRALDGDA